MVHPALLPVDKLLSQCQLHPTRRSGPGGQHRNKVQTAIVIEHLPTGIHGEASERRSQAANRERAIHRLRLNLALAIRQSPPKDNPHLWQKRIRGGRISINPNHQDFPALLAIALDNVWNSQFVMSDSAEQLGITTTQLIKLLKLEPAALTAINRERQKHGTPPLR
ncbi:MAG: peptide chain release factor-like protein [Planctomycetaceae bacterium]|nr:peptide chain release factor-like protein [Planctomycetaceae bacterium]